MPESAPVAIFLSYAREDAVAARRIAEALRASGLEVWFDENELRGGDAWDAKIRRQIDACGLFVPLISGNTESRPKGYFRLEWKLAVEQTHLLAEGVPFLAPVVIDDTRETGAMVPAEFLKVQWTRLPGALPSPQFVEQIGRLARAPRVPTLQKVEPGRPRAGERGEGAASPAKPAEGRRRGPVALWVGVGAAVVVGVAGVIFATARKPERVESVAAPPQKALVESRPAAPEKTGAALGEKSIAVLPFASLGADKENEPFADGVHEDVITHLTKIRDLSVISRTSVLGYRDVATRDLRKIATALGVATVLEGSVRKAGNQVKVSAQLIDTHTAATRWADSYEGDLTNVFALQARLAQEIAGALKITLTTNERALIERRPTENQEAYELYMRARAISQEIGERGTLADYERILALYRQALAKDPAFALAHVQSAFTHSITFWFGRLDPSPARAEKTKAAADEAVRLAPNAPETHLALGAYYYRVLRDWNRALSEFRLAERELPNDAQLHFWLAATHRRLGQWPEALRYFERSAALSPHDLATVYNYAASLRGTRRWAQAAEMTARHQGFFPTDRGLGSERLRAQFMLDGNREAFLRNMAALAPDTVDPAGLADVYQIALWRGEWAAAARVLEDSRLKAIPSHANVIEDPITLHRAAVAFLRGDGAAARQFAGQAISSLRAGQWNERQKPWVGMDIAQAAAFAGDGDTALREAEAALAEARARDALDFVHLRLQLARVHLVMDRRDAAFTLLRECVADFCEATPNELRLDPFWARVKDDPRFEEILKTAKSL